MLRDAVPALARDTARGAEHAAAHGGEHAAVGEASRVAENETTKVLQDAVARSRQRLLDDPERAAGLLSRGERQALEDLEHAPWMTRIHFGNALERDVARDPAVMDELEHVGGAGRPDFTDAAGRGYEVTTSNPGTVAAHLLRDYVDPTRLATYDPIPFSFHFPSL